MHDNSNNLVTEPLAAEKEKLLLTLRWITSFFFHMPTCCLIHGYIVY